MEIGRQQVMSINIEDMYKFHKIIESYLFTDKEIEQLIKSYEVYQIITDNYKLKKQIRELKNIINKE
jgi:Spy/CpxP family protein refolding chaperone